MSGTPSAPEAPWILRRPQWAMIAAHIPIIAAAPAYITFGTPGAPRAPALLIAVGLVLGVVMGAIQLRHSLAAARGERPRYGLVTLAVLVVLTYVPLAWYGWNWVAMQLLVITSTLIIFPRKPAVALSALPILGTAVAFAVSGKAWPVGASFSAVNGSVIWMFSLTIVPASLYGSARLVRMVDELQAARTELAELAIGRERLRVSRNLHDLLGQSLSAISLKGDLALRLLNRNKVPAARTQIEDLTGVARDALRDMRAITRDDHAVSLRNEMDGAARLLQAANVETKISKHVPGLAPPAEEVMAWAIREGVTNMLRHSEARSCAITIARRKGWVRLEIVNDGVQRASEADPPRDPARQIVPATLGMDGSGTGLTGLAERARTVGGTAAAEPAADGRFRLWVDIPEETN